MKRKLLLLCITLVIFIGSRPLHASINYTINFSGSGASAYVDSVIVQNLTTGGKISVASSYSLLLSDQTNETPEISTNINNIQIVELNKNGEYRLTFYTQNKGYSNISLYTLAGIKVCDINADLNIGYNSYDINLGHGVFIARVKGNNYTYSAKLQNYLTVSFETSSFKYSGYSATKQKANTVTPTAFLKYNAGDLLLLKGKSANYTTIITDIPTSSKTINFEFIECKDANGNNYSVVKIGNQTWMAENLKATKFRTTDQITNTNNASDWGSTTTGGYVDYNSNITNTSTYGTLYNWYAINDTKNIAPQGWKIPTDADWTTLTTTLGGESIAGDKLKESSINYWGLMNSGTNNYGFGALPGGYRLSNGTFYYQGTYAAWWTGSEGSTSTKAYYRMISSTLGSVSRSDYSKNGGFAVRCIKSSIPTITTTSITSLKSKSLISGGNVTDNGGETVTEYGICWSTNTAPTIANNKLSMGNGNGSYNGTITGLTPATTYYIRAYATNSIGTAYGNEISTTTLLIDPVVDADGNIYNTITLGNQTWMTENLRTTKYRNGDLIGTTSSLYTDITYTTSPKYQWAYEGSDAYALKYGRLYTWYVVADSRNIAPEGYHVASESDWAILLNYLIASGYNYDKTTSDNKTAQALSTTDSWNYSSIIGTPGYNQSQNNSTGLSICPSGYRGFDGYYYIMGVGADIWTSTETSSTTANGKGCGFNMPTLNSFSSNKKYGFSVRCIKNSVPVVTTTAASAVNSNDAICGGAVATDGGETVTESGICWNTTGNPTINNSKKSISAGVTTFSSTITGLSASTTYYIRAYATNSLGTAYGDQITITTQAPTVTDIDGNVYHTVVIGTQTWMVENLKTTKYNDGTTISYSGPDLDWISTSTAAYGYPNGSSVNKVTYGLLYNWYAANSSKIAPAGWHVPTKAEIETLVTYLGGNSAAGGSLKETGTSHWIYGNTGASNTSGFTAIPAGYITGDTGSLQKFGYNSVFWSTTPGTTSDTAYRILLDYASITTSINADSKISGYSIRCIKN
ncbi:MAG: hypothetical protein RIS29_2358 [Bacteroidota bacterium]|jgi:uncharacterized protein (TIGR02145 family)